MRLSFLLLAAMLALGPANLTLADEAIAQPTTEVVADLGRTMKFDALFAVLDDEGKTYGQTLEDQMFPGVGGPHWSATVAAIYDIPRLRAAFDAALAAELAADPEAIAQMLAFFGSPRGQRIVTREIEARRSLMDIAAKEAAEVAADKLATARDPRMGLIKRLVDAGDLLEMNVAGSMGGSLAFTQGMADAGLYGDQMTEAQMLSDVWGQEDQIRADTQTWLNSYLALAYQPLSDADLEAYIGFSQTPAGEKLNAALFSAFDQVFRQVSLDLGHAAARVIMGSNI